MAEHALLLPFLNKDPVYCYGVELGMQIIAPMLRGKRVIKGYFRTENEEQIRLACYRLGYDLLRCKPWRFDRKYTGWVWMVMRKKEKVPCQS
jgi:hypothetical protein